jgi:hypothetical protein
LRIFLGNGDRSFQPAIIVSLDTGIPGRVAVGDFNGDGHLDLAVGTYNWPPMVSVLLGNGDGTFQAAQAYVLGGIDIGGSLPGTVVAADFNRDGKLDLAVADADGGPVSVLLGNGDGTFQPAQQYPGGRGFGDVAVADFNLDGIPDLAVNGLAMVGVFLGKGDGTFQAAQSYPVGFSRFLAVGDFNGDGYPDIAAPNDLTASGWVTVLLNDANWGRGR